MNWYEQWRSYEAQGGNCLLLISALTHSFQKTEDILIQNP